MATEQPRLIIVAPNRNIGEHLCSIFGLPKKFVYITPNTLRGLGPNTVFMVYEGLGMDNRYRDELELNMKMSGGLVIRVPEIARVVR